jgi:hypothetical protein
MSDLKFNCPHCEQSLEAPDEMLGQTIDCPSCNCQIDLPKKEPLSEPAPTPRAETKDCPYCGEDILAKAKKCKHCGEFLDEKKPEPRTPAPQKKFVTTNRTQIPAAPQTVPTPRPQTVTTQLTSKHLKIQVLFSALMFWIGLIWLIFAIVAASQDNSLNSAPIVPGIITFVGAIWGIITKVRIWWHHE